ncbi:MAG: asparaginase [Betaproteobacteria bacterium]|nr:asparaginase [Betaproteobacteria bacterium]
MATGGTMAGWAPNPNEPGVYQAAQLGIQGLWEECISPLDAADPVHNAQICTEQVAQIDSKDMSLDVWKALLRRVHECLMQPDVAGVVVAHGSDTAEETAFMLHHALSQQDKPILIKPVVLTCAMRPANVPAADGPQNLRDAVRVALDPKATGVLLVCAGDVHGARAVQKVQATALNPFSSGIAGPLARVQSAPNERPHDGEVYVTWLKSPAGFIPTQRAPQTRRRPIQTLWESPEWPRVEIVWSHALASGWALQALLNAEVSAPPPKRLGSPKLLGLVVAGTGNCTVHESLEPFLQQAAQMGVKVVRTTRCLQGGVQKDETPSTSRYQGLSPFKARIALMIDLLISYDDLNLT